MRTTTTAVLAVGATALAIPTTAAKRRHVQSSVQVPLAGHLTVASQMQAEHTELAQQRLTRKAWRLADKVAARARPRLLAARLPAPRQGRATGRRSPAACASCGATCTPPAAPSGAAPQHARRLPHARGDRGLRVRRQPGHGHRQRLLRQVSVHAADVGRASAAAGNPAAASEAEQNRRAAVLYAREGASPWPVCGR